MASVFTDCDFDVVSVASNHAMDWGEVALLDTIDLLHAKGIQTVGAGRHLEAARQPVIIERHGVKVAFLAYCSVLRDGYAAASHKAGVAPLRAHTYYEPMEYQAGTPPRVVTVPYEDDLAAMLADITAVRAQADVVVLMLHWGIHFIPKVIADYQTTVARAAFDAGAHLILGHHAHLPKAIEVYQGNVCFYSLSNFIMSAPEASQARLDRMMTQYGVTLDPDYPRLPYGADAKRTLIARALCTSQGVQRVSFLPALIDKQLRPEVLRHDDSRFDDAVRYMTWASDGFVPRLQIEGDEVVIGAE
jgi:poly-gamma-glutamate synthesis protein (capsule biosynthesis protein)